MTRSTQKHLVRFALVSVALSIGSMAAGLAGTDFPLNEKIAVLAGAAFAISVSRISEGFGI